MAGASGGAVGGAKATKNSLGPGKGGKATVLLAFLPPKGWIDPDSLDASLGTLKKIVNMPVISLGSFA